MPIGILYWILVILWAINAFFGWGGVVASNGLLLVLFGLLGWKNFGPPLQ